MFGRKQQLINALKKEVAGLRADLNKKGDTIRRFNVSVENLTKQVKEMLGDKVLQQESTIGEQRGALKNQSSEVKRLTEVNSKLLEEKDELQKTHNKLLNTMKQRDDRIHELNDEILEKNRKIYNLEEPLEDKKARARKMLDAGDDIETVANAVGRDKSTVYRWFKDLEEAEAA